MKVQVNEVEVGNTIKVKVHTNSDKTTSHVLAHTVKAETGTVTEIVDCGRYVVLVLDGDREVFTGRASKASLVA